MLAPGVITLETSSTYSHSQHPSSCLQLFRLHDVLRSTTDRWPFFETFFQFDSGLRSFAKVLFEFFCHRQKIFSAFVAHC